MHGNGQCEPAGLSQIGEDKQLVEEILSGSEGAWHQFVLKYSGLINGILQRHLFAEDPDDIRSLYVDVLHMLYHSALANYKGKAQLSTWLIVLVRGKAYDFIRHRRGRYREPKSLGNLSALDREVLRLYYVERMSLEVVVYLLKASGHAAGAVAVVASIQRIENTVDRRFLTRLDNGHVARQHGVRSISMLKYLIHHRQEYNQRVREGTVEAVLLEQASREEARRVRELLLRLPADERQAIDLRYLHDLPAQDIADRMGLAGPRKAYTLVNRAMRRLRSWISDDKRGRVTPGRWRS